MRRLSIAMTTDVALIFIFSVCFFALRRNYMYNGYAKGSSNLEVITSVVLFLYIYLVSSFKALAKGTSQVENSGLLATPFGQALR